MTITDCIMQIIPAPAGPAGAGMEGMAAGSKDPGIFNAIFAGLFENGGAALEELPQTDTPVLQEMTDVGEKPAPEVSAPTARRKQIALPNEMIALRELEGLPLLQHPQESLQGKEVMPDSPAAKQVAVNPGKGASETPEKEETISNEKGSAATTGGAQLEQQTHTAVKTVDSAAMSSVNIARGEMGLHVNEEPHGKAVGINEDLVVSAVTRSASGKLFEERIIAENRPMGGREAILPAGGGKKAEADGVLPDGSEDEVSAASGVDSAAGPEISGEVKVASAEISFRSSTEKKPAAEPIIAGMAKIEDAADSSGKKAETATPEKPFVSGSTITARTAEFEAKAAARTDAGEIPDVSVKAKENDTPEAKVVQHSGKFQIFRNAEVAAATVEGSAVANPERKLDPAAKDSDVKVDIASKDVSTGGSVAGKSSESAMNNFENGNSRPGFHGAEIVVRGKDIPESSSVEALNRKESSPSIPQEQIVSQVKEKLSLHARSGDSGTITMKLNPEQLGELQVNMKMENQRIKVEIVAENQAVKEALMSNMETLREALSRQNISVDRFNVLTGGGQGFGEPYREWRESARHNRPDFVHGTAMSGEAGPENRVRYADSREDSLVDVRL